MDTTEFRATYRPGSKWKVLTCPSRPDLVGEVGSLKTAPAIAANPVLTVVVDGVIEVQQTAEKFEQVN